MHDEHLLEHITLYSEVGTPTTAASYWYDRVTWDPGRRGAEENYSLFVCLNQSLFSIPLKSEFATTQLRKHVITPPVFLIVSYLVLIVRY